MVADGMELLPLQLPIAGLVLVDLVNADITGCVAASAIDSFMLQAGLLVMQRACAVQTACMGCAS